MRATGNRNPPIAARIVLAFVAASLAGAVRAEWPRDKPIDLIVGFAAGGGQDIMARTLAPHLERHLPGARFVIQNRPGAGGEIAYTAVARAAPDGYTFGIVSTPGLVAIPLQRKAQYDLASLVPVARIVDDATAVVVARTSRFETLKAFIDRARADPGGVSAGFNGVGTNGHIGSALVERAAGVKFNTIPYQGTGQSRPALLGGHVDSVFMGLGEYLEFSKDSKTPVRLLGYMAEARIKEAGNVPTFREIGLDLIASSERGIAAPRGVPSAIATRLAEAIERAIKDAGFIESAAKQSLLLAYLPGPEWGRRMEVLAPRLAEIMAAAPKESSNEVRGLRPPAPN
jgi:tripartite-type tricarboxylate transporter receptor subunit TctC